MRPFLANVTVAPITSRIRVLSTEVPVGPAHGLDQDSVISCDSIQTIPVADLGRQLGFLTDDRERELTEAILAAFDLDLPAQRRQPRGSRTRAIGMPALRCILGI